MLFGEFRTLNFVSLYQMVVWVIWGAWAIAVWFDATLKLPWDRHLVEDGGG
jgi:hypothetical protein